jgi:hypothetical protein
MASSDENIRSQIKTISVLINQDRNFSLTNQKLTMDPPLMLRADNNKIVFNVFGSANSTDIDFLILLSQRPRGEELTLLCQTYTQQLQPIICPDRSRELDCNLGLAENGVLTWVYKGTIDTTNNAIFETYRLHRQWHPCFITRRLGRNLPAIIVQTLRIILTKVTRTSIRAAAREALRCRPYCHWQFLSQLDFEKFTYNAKRTSAIENYKTIAFQVGQLSALLRGQEIFTKEEIAVFDPRLDPFLRRATQFKLKDLTAALFELTEAINIYGQTHPEVWTLNNDPTEAD